MPMKLKPWFSILCLAISFVLILVKVGDAQAIVDYCVKNTEPNTYLFAYLEDAYPISFQDGYTEGLDPKTFCGELFKHLKDAKLNYGLKSCGLDYIQVSQLLNEGKLYDAAKESFAIKVGCFPAVIENQEKREEVLNRLNGSSTISYVSFDDVFLIRKNDELQYDEAYKEAFKGKRLAVIKGTTLVDRLRKKYPRAYILEFASRKEVINEIKNNQNIYAHVSSDLLMKGVLKKDTVLRNAFMIKDNNKLIKDRNKGMNYSLVVYENIQLLGLIDKWIDTEGRCSIITKLKEMDQILNLSSDKEKLEMFCKAEETSKPEEKNKPEESGGLEDHKNKLEVFFETVLGKVGLHFESPDSAMVVIVLIVFLLLVFGILAMILIRRNRR